MILSFAPIALLIFLLFSAVQLFGADASYGPNQVALLIASAICWASASELALMVMVFW